MSNEQAILLVRSMVAAAASNHQFDEAERMRITLGLRYAGEVALRHVEDDIDTDGLKIQEARLQLALAEHSRLGRLVNLVGAQSEWLRFLRSGISVM